MSGSYRKESIWRKVEKAGNVRGKFARYYDQPVVIVTKAGEFALSEKSYETLGKPAYVAVVMDDVQGRAGFAPGSADDINDYKVEPTNHMAYVSATAFAKRYGLAGEKPRVYKCEMDGRVLAFDLHQVPSTV